MNRIIYGDSVPLNSSKVPFCNLLDKKWSQTGDALRLNRTTLKMAAVANSRLTLMTTGYLSASAGQIARLTLKVSNLTTANARLQITVAETVSTYAETDVTRYIYSSGLICIDHVVQKNCNLLIYIGNVSSSPGTVEIEDVRLELKTGDHNSLISFGDSIGAGSKLAGNLDDNLGCYTTLFATKKNIPYSNYSTSGDKLVNDILPDVQAILGTVGAILKHPNLLFVEGGINDIFTATEDCTVAMQTAITTICEIGVASGANIVLFNIPSCNLSGSKETWRTTHNAWLASYAAANSHVLVPVDTIIDNPQYYEVATDYTHFNTAGHLKILDWMELNGVSYNGDNIPLIPDPAITLTIPDEASRILDVSGLRIVTDPVGLTPEQFDDLMNKDLK